MAEKEFINNWVIKLRNGGLKKFPDEFVLTDDTRSLDLPSKTLILGPELFGTYEILDSQGNKIFQAENIANAKYILYANNCFPERIKIPNSIDDVNSALKSYEQYLDGMVKSIIAEFRTLFPEKKNFFEVSNIIFNSLDLHRY
jgi:hypothetical protein